MFKFILINADGIPISIGVMVKLKPDRQVYEQSHVLTIFETIADHYDFLNHLLSSGIDILWRRRAIRLLQPLQPKRILDVATGTADLAIEASRLQPEQIIGIDFSPKMIAIGQAKVQKRDLEKVIKLNIGKAEELNFESDSFDVVMSAFGIRNFTDLKKGLSEFHRVLRPNGAGLILEFSKPQHFPVKQIYGLYSRYILPWLGGLISKNAYAYQYLPNTIAEFPEGEDICKLLKYVGFSDIYRYPQTFGIATIYFAIK
jgi:demethylmenaquinone methyltransferase/2-methoxy-6-polyprenyl-1,4-benzoquinol methylase